MRVFVPKGCVRINQMLLSYSVEAFRAYETGASSGGGTSVTSSAGGGSEKTSSAGGAATTTTETKVVSFALVTDGMYRADDGSSMTYAYGGTDTTGNGGDGSSGSASGETTGCKSNGEWISNTGTAGAHSHTVEAHSHSLNGHSHGLNGHSHSFSDTYSLGWGHTHSIPDPGSSSNTGGVNSYSAKSISISGTTGGNSGDTAGNYGSTGNQSPGTNAVEAHSHGIGHVHGLNSHSHSLPAHSHSIPSRDYYIRHYHFVTGSITIPELTLSLGSHRHTVTIDNHTHSVAIQPHTHDIVHGIYEGGTANQIAIKVVGVAVPGDATASADELDIVSWLEKDAEGKITRGAWHTVELVPNALTRINANLFVQAFVQSVGGGDY